MSKFNPEYYLVIPYLIKKNEIFILRQFHYNGTLLKMSIKNLITQLEVTLLAAELSFSTTPTPLWDDYHIKNDGKIVDITIKITSLKTLVITTKGQTQEFSFYDFVEHLSTKPTLSDFLSKGDQNQKISFETYVDQLQTKCSSTTFSDFLREEKSRVSILHRINNGLYMRNVEHFFREKNIDYTLDNGVKFIVKGRRTVMQLHKGTWLYHDGEDFFKSVSVFSFNDFLMERMC